MEEETNKKRISVAKIVKIVVYVAVYLNIGWALGTYYHYNIMYQKPQTFIQTIAAGGWEFFSNFKTLYSLITDQILWMLFWPLWICSIVVTWILKGISYFLWLVFAGGIAKLLGVG